MVSVSKSNHSYKRLGRQPILLSTDQLTTVVGRIGALHAQLYSNYAGRWAVVEERLRWRVRLRCDNDLSTEGAIKKRVELLRYQSQTLNEERKVFLTEKTRLIDQLNIFGYTVSWEDGKLVLRHLP